MSVIVKTSKVFVIARYNCCLILASVKRVVKFECRPRAFFLVCVIFFMPLS